MLTERRERRSRALNRGLAALLAASLTAPAMAQDQGVLSEDEATRARLAAKLEAAAALEDTAAAADGSESLDAPDAEPARAVAPPAPYPGRCGDAAIAEFSWATARLSARILEIALADGYGCAVRRPAADPGPALAAVAASAARKGGERVIALEAPKPEPIPEGVALGAEIYGGLERAGWFTPAWFAAANPEIRRLEDLREAADAFRARPDERPKLHICPADWPCHAVDRAMIAHLKLEGRFEIVTPTSGDALTASLTDAWRARRPWLGSYWSPSAAIAAHPMARLEPGAVQLCETPPSAYAPAERPEPLCAPPHAAAPRMVLYPATVEADFPELAAFLRRFAIPPELIMEGLAWRAESNASLEDAALRLLERNPQLWRSWMEDEARQAFDFALARRAEAARAAAKQAQADNEALRAPLTPPAGGAETPG